jgi:hypothetical protein
MNIYGMKPVERDVFVPIEPTTPLTLQLLERLSFDITALPEGPALDTAVDAYVAVVSRITERSVLVAFREEPTR